jgi:AraC family transcriptional regulator
METSIGVPTFWNRLAEAMYLKDSPTAEVRLSEPASFSLGRFRNSEPLPEVARPLLGEHGYLVVLQLKAIPFIEQFLRRIKVSSGYYPIGAVSAIDLREEPSVLLPNPFDALLLYVTQASLDEISYTHQAPRVERLVWPLGTFDPVVFYLGKALFHSMEQPHLISKIVLDHLLHAMNCHFVFSYGGVAMSTPPFRGGLSVWQTRRATEFLVAHLDGDITLQQIAEQCELSVSHFTRAFKKTFRMSPYKWLTELRVERAKDLMMTSRLPLVAIAARCGFTDQAALNHFFKRRYGVTPGVWRRENLRRIQ